MTGSSPTIRGRKNKRGFYLYSEGEGPEGTLRSKRVDESVYAGATPGLQRADRKVKPSILRNESG
jgi:hypothetical protein